MKKYYVYFFKNGREVCECFENEEEQARHFATLVNGRFVVEG